MTSSAHTPLLQAANANMVDSDVDEQALQQPTFDHLWNIKVESCGCLESSMRTLRRPGLAAWFACSYLHCSTLRDVGPSCMQHSTGC